MATANAGIRHATKSPSKKSKGLRPDIQGLRALAVLAVIADHTFTYPSGGFVGVDVFFVISGFLITGLLLREHEKKGRISFADFYRRRARRILPLAVLVLVATVAASWAVFNGGRAMKVTEDALWSLVFGTNWHLALIGTDYMQAGAAVSPLQHFWSLAVEEQFYVVWPWLIVLILGTLAGRLGWQHGKARLLLTGMMVLFVAVSLAFAMWETATSPTVAYFSTFSRAWELGIGAVLAASAGALSRLPDAIRPVLAYIGLAGIVWGIFAITPEMPFPGPWAAVPVLATALLIAAGTGGEVRFLAPLTNPISRYIGDISYSLYLWHFPIIVLFGALLPVEGPLLFAAILAAAGGMSVLSYHLLEDPIRKSGWLEPKGKRAPSTDAKQKAALGGLVALALVTTCVVGAALAQDAGSRHTAVAAVPVPLATTGKDVPKTPESEHTAKINAALQQTAWPDLNPSVDNLGQGAKATEWVKDGCLGGDSRNLEADIAKAQTCVYGEANAAKTAVVVGDSIAISYVPMVRAALEPKGYKVVVYTMQQCPAISVSVFRGDKSEHPRCDPFRQWALDQVKASKPDMVILSSSEDASMRLVSKAEGTAVVSEWIAGTKDTLNSVAGSAGRVVLLDPPPGGKALQECATRVSKPSDCMTAPDNRYGELYSAVRDAAAAVPAAKAEVIRTRDWFCSGNNCPGFVGTTPVYADQGHMTPNYASELAPLFASALKL
ncbi:peptidoglycan/LPS O-acetylase OafA/YrhL [Pseudarthrobacter defluvii]|uniref:acyltransferase family protein n=1 Tax=Pseudarthrobacter defluvii TaxID=410837 RepID=UPI002789F656|nr:acyltransferase family protein [Pseudarthrobacter defluvii]MDQ0767989.1 peptidoglycan/LPS O-acetylase OafA/YrhL [Pseudarthrobacter defluvii]